MLCRIGAAKNSTEHIEVLTLNTLCSEGSQNLSLQHMSHVPEWELSGHYNLCRARNPMLNSLEQGYS